MTVLYPSARVRLLLRLDEGVEETADIEFSEGSNVTTLDLVEIEAAPPTAPTSPTLASNKEQQLNLIREQLDTLNRVRTALPSNDYRSQKARLEAIRDATQLGIIGADSQPQHRPLAVDGAPPDELTVLGGILPTTCSVERNDIRTADTASLDLDFRDLPVDPRAVRSVFVEIVMGAVSDSDYAVGLDGLLRPVGFGFGMPFSVVPRSEDQDLVAEGTTRFVGFVDTWNVTHNDAGDTVSLTCRDMSSLLIDTPLGTERINLDLPLDRAIQELMEVSVATRGIRVFVGSPGAPEVAPIPSRSISRALKGRRGRRSKKGKAGGERASLWDHITDTCIQIGLVPIFQGYTLFLMRPRTFWAGRTQAARFIYGRDVESFEINRKLAGVAQPTLEVRCYDPTIGRTLWARAPTKPGLRASGILGQTDPPKNARAARVQPSGKASDTIEVRTVDGITDVVVLEQIAESLFEQIGRQEIEGSVETIELTSSNGFDLLNLQSGDAVEILVGRPNEFVGQGNLDNSTEGGTLNNLQELHEMSIARRAQFLEALGWDAVTAQRLSAAQERVDLAATFRVKMARVSWSAEGGLKIAIDFVNFLVARIEEQSQTQVQPVSLRTEELVGDRKDEAAERLERLSQEAQTLTQARAEGRLSDEEYTAQAERIAADRRAATQVFRQ